MTRLNYDIEKKKKLNKFVNFNNNIFFGQNAFNHHALNIPNGGFIRA